jgi:hypothetical protein
VISIARTAGVDRVGLLTEDGKHSVVAGLCPAGTERSPVTPRTSKLFNGGLPSPEPDS